MAHFYLPDSFTDGKKLLMTRKLEQIPNRVGSWILVNFYLLCIEFLLFIFWGEFVAHFYLPDFFTVGEYRNCVDRGRKKLMMTRKLEQLPNGVGSWVLLNFFLIFK